MTDATTMMRRALLVLPLAGVLAGVLAGPVQAETVARYAISMADIPLTTGQPDRGPAPTSSPATRSTTRSSPGKTESPTGPANDPGLATEWKADPANPRSGPSRCVRT